MTFINANVLSNIVSLQCLSSLLNALLQNTMAEQNVPTQPPTRTDEQIVPRSQWLTIGKSNLLFNAQKIQKNPIFQISVDILSNTNFFQAFTASANVPAIYLQQFWNTMKYNEKTGVYSCQVDEQWFDLSADLLRKALAITPVIPAHPFELPPSGNTVIDFVNELGYPEPVEIVSNIRVNYVYQPWRAILTLINQCLTGKTSGSDKPRHPVLQMLWGIVTQTNVDHAELIWEEFTQGIQTFFSHKASHNASLKNPKKKVTPLLIPYGRFSKVIIYYLASNNNIHRRPGSAVHHTGDDYILGNLKFVPKGESVEVFGMAIPDPLITKAIQQSSYYPKYLEMVAENTKKTPQESVSVQPATKRDTPKKPITTTPVKQSKPAPPPSKKSSKRRAPVGGVTIRDPVSEATPKLYEVVGKGKAVVTEEQVAHSLIDLSKKKRILIIVSFLVTESETEAAAPKGDKDQDESIPSTVTSGTVMSTPPVIAPFTDVSSTQPSSLVTPPPINTEAITITTSLPEITPFIALQLRVARLEQEMSKVKKTDHQADVLASIKSQVSTAVDKYLGTKLDDALLKILERHTADLIEKYSVLLDPDLLIDKVDLEEFDLKSALFNHMNKKKSANRNTANYHLYHALMEALIADEDAMDKEVADKVKDHKRKHDSDDDEDDE
ncbi:hypothetical protein Tco_0103755 [Tanacetum coccineum]